MREILPGVYHWSTPHPKIKINVSSYYIVPARTVLDPLVPEEGFEALPEPAPERVVLTNRHHVRHSERFRDHFGISIHAPAAGMHEFGDGDHGIKPYAPGDELGAGIIAHEQGAICADDMALHIDTQPAAFALADGLVNRGGELGFVGGYLLGDNPEQVKREIRQALARLLDEDFDALLFAHGDPIPAGGRAALESFLSRPEG